MTDKFHLNIKTGAVGRCHAEVRDCPVGGADMHFGKVAEARAVYEKSMEGKTFAANSKKDTMKSLAANSPNLDEQLQAVEQGGWAVFEDLAKNKAAHGEALVAAFDASDSSIVRAKLVSNTNFPVEKLDPEHIGIAYSAAKNTSGAWGHTRVIDDSDHLTDAHLDAMSGAYEYGILKNPNNKISQERINKLARKNVSNLKGAIESGRFSMASEIDDLSEIELREAARYATKQEDLDLLADKASSAANLRYVRWSLVQNPELSDESMRKMIESSEDNDTDALVLAYKRARTPELKALAREKNQAVKNLDTITRLNDELDGNLGEAIGAGHEERGGPSSQRRTIRFDAEKVEQLGLSAGEIDAYVRWHRGNYLFGGKYDAKTGVYSGYID